MSQCINFQRKNKEQNEEVSNLGNKEVSIHQKHLRILATEVFKYNLNYICNSPH